MNEKTNRTKKVRNDQTPRDLKCCIIYDFEREGKTKNDLNTQKKKIKMCFDKFIMFDIRFDGSRKKLDDIERLSDEIKTFK